MGVLVLLLLCFSGGRWVGVNCFGNLNVSEISANENTRVTLKVPQTLVEGAVAIGAVCLDGSPPAYHLDRGQGSGANSWLIDLEGGGWCNNIRICDYKRNTNHGSSLYMEKEIAFSGILSNNEDENPDFFNWNRVKIRYCDGASFAGEGQDEAAMLYFRGQRIWKAAMDELLLKGMSNAKEALLSGCSAGGLAVIIHCNQFHSFFSRNTEVKCLSDAGLFLDVHDISGAQTARAMFQGVVTLQNVEKSLSGNCASNMDSTSCFFPQNLIDRVKPPLFILNAAYDSWQIIASLAPRIADPNGLWDSCKADYRNCSDFQMSILQNFRTQMIDAVKGFEKHSKNGLFINSCFAHCQTERQDTWFSKNSPRIGNKSIAISVGDWFFNRSTSSQIATDCPYPCDNTCHNLVFHFPPH